MCKKRRTKHLKLVITSLSSPLVFVSGCILGSGDLRQLLKSHEHSIRTYGKYLSIPRMHRLSILNKVNNLECILPKLIPWNADFFWGSLNYAASLYFYAFDRVPALCWIQCKSPWRTHKTKMHCFPSRDLQSPRVVGTRWNRQSQKRWCHTHLIFSELCSLCCNLERGDQRTCGGGKLELNFDALELDGCR